MVVIGKKILVRPDRQDKTPGGVVIPDKYRPQYRSAKVIALGEEVSRVNPCHSVVIYSALGARVTVNGEDLLVVNEADIIGILEEGDTLGVAGRDAES